jgi:hypothetical protein
MRLILPFFIFLQILAVLLSSACFFHRIVYPGGVWSFSVIGYAIFVGLLFQVAKKYDARVQPASWRLHQISALLLYIEIVLVATLHIYISYVVAQALFLTLFGITVFLDCFVTHRLLVQNGVSWSTRRLICVICYLRIVFWVVSTPIYFAFLNEGKISEVALYFVALASYTNCLHFIANWYGILRPETLYASNGSLFERFKAFIASCFEKFEIESIRFVFDMVLNLLLVVYILICELYLRISETYWLISHAVFALLCFAVTRFINRYDPRKPPDADFLIVRKRRWQLFCMTLLFVSAISWIRMPLIKTSVDVKILVCSLTNSIIILRYVSMIALQKVEVPYPVYASGDTFGERFVEISLMVVACAITFINLVPQIRYLEVYFFTIMRSFLFLSTMQSIHMISGRYRDKVRQENVVQVVIAEVHPAVIDPYPENEPEYRPFRRSERYEEAISV